MLTKELRKKIEAIQKDNYSGSVVLTQKALETLQWYLQHCSAEEKQEFLYDLRSICAGLMLSQRMMASIQNICLRALTAVVNRKERATLAKMKQALRKELLTISSEILLAREKIAAFILRLVPKGSTIITLSYSSTVVYVLKYLHKRKKEISVIIMESRPLFEGRRTVTELARVGVPVTLIADAAVGQFCQRANLAIVGTDMILVDGKVINKIGTYPLALCCHEAKIPLYVVADSRKFILKGNDSIHLEKKSPTELYRNAPGRNISVENIYFDITPPTYFTRIITEKGIFTPQEIHH